MATQENIITLLEDESTFGYNELRFNAEANVLFDQKPLVKSTVELFCFGDYTYYTQHKDEFVELSPKAVYKLKQLSLASEALKSSRLQYSHLQTTLDFSSKLDLEIFLAESISEKIIDATLLGQEELVRVKSSRGRDVLLDDEPNEEELVKKYDAKTVSDLITALKKFNQRIDQGHTYILKLSGEKVDERGDTPGPDPKVTEKPEELKHGTGEADVSAMAVDEALDELKNDTETEEKGDDGNDDDPPSRKRKID